jgi:Tfp pilus assembly protein FimT
MPELMIVAGIMCILMAIALPRVVNLTQTYRLTADSRGIAAAIRLARTRAASRFTRTQVNFNSAHNTYRVEVWNKATKAYASEGGSKGLATSAVHSLKPSDVFGYGELTTPAGAQTAIAQTTQISFNSHGFSVDSAGKVTGNSVVYFTNNSGGYGAVSVSVAGEPIEWRWNSNSSQWTLSY